MREFPGPGIDPLDEDPVSLCAPCGSTIALSAVHEGDGQQARGVQHTLAGVQECWSRSECRSARDKVRLLGDEGNESLAVIRASRSGTRSRRSPRTVPAPDPAAIDRLCARASRGLGKFTRDGWQGLLREVVDEIRVSPDPGGAIHGLVSVTTAASDAMKLGRPPTPAPQLR